MKLTCFLLVVLLGLCSAQSFDPDEESASLKIVSPDALKTQFPKGVYLKPAMFGSPMHIDFDEKKITGQVLFAPSDDDDGCKPINKTEFNVKDNDLSPYIIMVERGSCDFVVKVQHVQDIGAKAAIIVNQYSGTWLPLMADDGNGTSIHIPSVLIRKADGDAIAKSLQTAPVVLSLAWNIPSPDNRVEWELWTSADDDDQDFKRNFDDVADVLGNATLFTPHYFIDKLNWCQNEAATSVSDLNCGYRCSNKGRYCWSNVVANGSLVMAETLRQLCLWDAVNGTADEPLWWDYVEEFDDVCIKDGAVDFSLECSSKAFKAKAKGSSLTIWPKVTQCVAASGGADLLGPENPRLEKELNASAERSMRRGFGFSILINGMPYYGGKSCPRPAAIDSCAVLDVLCLGFKDPSSIAACTTTPGCPLGQKVSGCDNTCGGVQTYDACHECLDPNDPKRVTEASKCYAPNTVAPTTGIPVWSTVLIVIACICLVAIGVFCFMKHRQNALKQDIDALMKQYMPMDGPAAGLNQ